MNQNESYAELLFNYLKLPFALIWIVAVAATILIAICLKIRYRRMAIITLIGGIVLSFAIYFTSVYPYQKDISENAFITYSGEFYVEDCYSVNRGGTYIFIRCNENDEAVRYKVLCNADDIEDDSTYHGTFVYSKYSGCLVAIEGQAE